MTLHRAGAAIARLTPTTAVAGSPRKPVSLMARKHLSLLLLLVGICLVATGCHTVGERNKHLQSQLAYEGEFQPHEREMTLLPPYVIEPPDILLINAIKVVPKPPYLIEALDVLQIQVEGTPPESPIAGPYPVGPGGSVDLGPPYGTVHVVDLTLDEAKNKIREYLEEIHLQSALVSVSLAQPAALQQISGEHLVGPDGQVTLGTYGGVRVAGLTLDEAKQAVEDHLSRFLDRPKVSMSVFAYNSKVYYIVMQGGGFGDQIYRFPITGNETVLDALSQIQAFTQASSENLWISRPAPDGTGRYQVMPVDWNAIVQGGATATNYQLLPGDRLFVAESKMVATDTFVNRAIAPFERIIGFTLLGTQTIQTINRFPRGLNNNNTGF
jgi:polysaccharide export outer membrane protein